MATPVFCTSIRNSSAAFTGFSNCGRRSQWQFEFCCSFEGKHKTKVGDDHKIAKTSKRNGCKGMVYARTAGDGGRAFFTRIVFEHNHKLVPSPSMTKRMRAHKVEDPAVMNLVDTMYASHVPYPNVMCVLRNIAGGAENLHLTERDIQNRRAAHVREERMDDIPKLLAIFRECKTNNPEFFCEFQLDEKNVVKNVFWSHASQQGDYADYSGVVTFDTTYRTNQYSMPLAMFVGFNNKLQNVVFGQALLRDERADTFDWLFRQFRACMVGKDPVDQDSSIEKAINLVFEKTYHRYCRWHVMNKYRNELNQFNTQHPGLSDTLTSIVNHPLRPVEFEEAWAAMLDKYAVHESKVLMNLYDERQMWIGAYFKDILCGMMTSMQRSESVNSAVKHCYCDNSIAIHEFVKSFLELLADNKENEAKEEFNSQAPVVTSTFYGIDNQLSRVYTSVVYKVFQERLKSSTTFHVRPDPDKACYHLVKHTRPPTNFPWLCHEFWVKAVVNEKIPEESEFNCECMRIEHTGMFCPHLLCVLTNLQMAHIPSRYIPKRYTRNAREDTIFDRHDKVYVGTDGDTTASRMLELIPDWCALQRKAIMSSEGVTKCKELLRQALQVINEIPHDMGSSAATTAAGLPFREEHIVLASAPPISSTKSSRKKSMEGVDAPVAHFKRPQGQKHTCRCSVCHKTGHSSTTCGREAPPPKRPRGRPVGSGTKRGNGMLQYESDDTEDDHSSEMEDDDLE
ncbi:hypothetical protein PVAP13_1NG122519 [Panicum virgatum]|uniref:Protein FAR1-RELATED SEQUENCE n=1 Tax=Panicum virgatum TaxID=38727 RepID=A0A8T0WWY0_PANVG|nr:hypothetical protein PVAP13_1NG122519 [Panicum virgatum]